VPQQEYASKLDQLVVTDDQISFRLNGLDAGFSARWNAQGKMWVGTWTQQGRSAPLNLERTDAAAQKPKRPQEDAIAARQPDYTSREVAFTNAPARITLSGTFSVPRGRQGGRDAG
jgi:hypothetical protein